MRRKKLFIILIAAAILIATPSLYLYSEARRAELNRMLIGAIVADQYDYALELLRRGADGTTRVGANGSIRQVLAQIADRVLHRTKPTTHTWPSALQILYMGCPHPEWPSTERLAVALLDSGCPTVPNSTDWQSFLEVAVSYHHHAFIRRLLTIDPKLAVGDGQALYSADPIDTATMLDHGALVDTPYENRTALFNSEATKAELLLARGAKIDVRDGVGMTALHSRCLFSDDAAVLVLLGHNASVTVRDAYGKTPLLWAVENCKLETVQRMVAYGADLRVRDRAGNTALMFAVNNHDARVLPWLLERGLDVNLIGAVGNTALSIVEQNVQEGRSGSRTVRYFTTLVALLHRHGARPHQARWRWTGGTSYWEP